MRRPGRTVVLLGAVAGLSGAVAATPPLPPGYVWGLANCGPVVNDTRRECENCCSRSFTNGTITAEERDGCLLMCEQSKFTRFPNWWERVLMWAFS